MGKNAGANAGADGLSISLLTAKVRVRDTFNLLICLSIIGRNSKHQVSAEYLEL